MFLPTDGPDLKTKQKRKEKNENTLSIFLRPKASKIWPRDWKHLSPAPARHASQVT
jgi:hypothetical protein